MQIPYDDNLKIEYLIRIFDRSRISTCYKYFWFLAILRKITPNDQTFSYDELITEMVADAWYMVAEYRLRLGPSNTTDNLEEAVKYLHDVLFKERVPATEKREKLIEKLRHLDDRTYLGYKRKLIDNVPYCLQTPFYGTKENRIKNPSKATITEINQQSRLLYYISQFDSLNTTISISDEWVSYLCRNREILSDWARYNLIGYLQDRNPSVPGIVEKILPPYKRNLTRVSEYWKILISADASLKDIYGNIPLGEIVSISIDHFVPWQYVAHDELWNLHPTAKDINSQKSNNLPDWKTYFDSLCKLEYKAHELSFTKPMIKAAFDKCVEKHVNSSDIYQALYSKQLGQADFCEKLEKVIRPVYDSAMNCGFREWVYTGKNQ